MQLSLQLLDRDDLGRSPGRERKDLPEQRWSPHGVHDLLIGATALAHGHRLATLNWREFSQVPGLNVVEIDQYRSA